MVLESNENLIATGLEARISLPQKFHSNPVTSKLIKSAFFKKDTQAIVKLLAEKVDKQELESSPELKQFLKSRSSELTEAAVLHGFPEVLGLAEAKLTRTQFLALREAYNTRTNQTVDSNTFIKDFNLEVEVRSPQKFHSNPVTSKLLRSAFFKNDTQEILKLLAEKVDKQELESNFELKQFLKSRSSELTEAAVLHGFPEVVGLAEAKTTLMQFLALREAYNTRTNQTVDSNTLIKDFNLEVEVRSPQKFHSNPVTSKLIESAFLKEDYQEAIKLIAKNINQEELDNNPELRNYLQLKGDKLVEAALQIDSHEINEKLKICLSKKQNQRLQEVSHQKFVKDYDKNVTAKTHLLRAKLAQIEEQRSSIDFKQDQHQLVSRLRRKLNKKMQSNEAKPDLTEKEIHLKALRGKLPPIDLSKINLKHNVASPRRESQTSMMYTPKKEELPSVDYDSLPVHTKIFKKVTTMSQFFLEKQQVASETRSKPTILPPLSSKPPRSF